MSPALSAEVAEWQELAAEVWGMFTYDEAP